MDLTISYMRAISKADALLEAKLMRSACRSPSAAAKWAKLAAKPAAFSTGTYAPLG